MKDDRCLIIAEAGVNHNGQLDLAIELCDAAKKSGADVVKFQTWITDEIITRNVGQANYQKTNTGKIESQYDMLKRLELSFDDFAKIKQHCDDIGIKFASTADDEKSLDFLVSLGIPFIKIGSGDICNVPYLRLMGKKKIPIIMSTGMSTLSDIDLSIRTLRESGAEDVTILHCTTNYPCPYNQVNLSAMNTLRVAFHVPVGYSDHTIGTEVPIAAVAMGAKVIEKHFTLDRSMEGPDHIASTEPDEFSKMVVQIRNLEVALGDGIKQPSISEKEIKKVITKRIVARKKILKGEAFSCENICVKRSEIGAEAREWDSIIGNVSPCEYEINDGIEVKFI